MKKNKFNKEAVLEQMYDVAKDLHGMDKFYALSTIAGAIEKMEPSELQSPYSSLERLNCGCIKEYGCSCTPKTGCGETCEDECGDMDELLVSFGNFVLQNRFSKMFGVNPEFISSILTLNPTFFEISDADLRNFEEVEF